MKRISALFITLVLLFSQAFPVYATETATVVPYYVNASGASVKLSVNNTGTATVQLSCSARTTMDSIHATTYLERNDGGTWVRVEIGTPTNTWTYSTTASRLIKTYSLTLLNSGEYRAVTVFVLNGTSTETITCIGTDSY